MHCLPVLVHASRNVNCSTARPSKMYTENGQCLNPATTKHMSQPHKPVAPFESATRQREVSAAWSGKSLGYNLLRNTKTTAASG